MDRVRPRRQIDAYPPCTLEQIKGGKASQDDGVGTGPPGREKLRDRTPNCQRSRIFSNFTEGIAGTRTPLQLRKGICPTSRLFGQVESPPLEVSEH
jgi:hypothetical protein